MDNYPASGEKKNQIMEARKAIIKKKILYVITKSNWGGAQRYVFDLATNLPKDRFDIIVACGGSGLLVDKLKSAGVRVIPIRHLLRNINWSNEIKALSFLYKVIRREKPDIIHLNSSKAGGLGALAAFVSKLLTLNFELLTVFTAHGWAFNEDRPRWQKSGIKFLSWLAAVFQDKIIVISQADFDSARELLPARKLVMIPHGIAQPNFLTREESQRVISLKIGRVFNTNDLIISSVAELNKNKGLNYLIDALHLIKAGGSGKGMYAVLIGDGQERLQLQSRIDSYGLGDTVFLAGFIPEAGHLLKAFDILVLPSVKEGLPYVVMEAMAAGLPVVASAVGGVPDLISHRREGLLVRPASVRDLRQALLEVAGDEKTRQNLGNKAETKMDQHFRLENMIAKTEALYLGNGGSA